MRIPDTDLFRTTVLVLAPTPFLAALFIGFGRISARVGAQYSRLSPAWCEYHLLSTRTPMYSYLASTDAPVDSRVFLAGDILSLFIQGGGGGIAASPSASPDKRRLVSSSFIHLTAICLTRLFSGKQHYSRRPWHPTLYVLCGQCRRLFADRSFSLVSMSMFCVLMAEYAWRRTTDRPYRKPAPGQPAENLPMTRHMKFLIIGICLSAFFIYVR